MQRKKSLILVLSLAGYTDSPSNTGYAASKYGVRGIFRSIRSRAHLMNARVNNIAPGYVWTPMTQRFFTEGKTEPPHEPPAGSLPWASIQDVEETVLRCAVDDSIDGKSKLYRFFCLKPADANNRNFIGRTFAIFPSGPADIFEDLADGFGGKRLVDLMIENGYAGNLTQ